MEIAFAVLKRLPSEEVSERYSMLQTACASQTCPSLDRLIEMGSLIVLIESKKNLALARGVASQTYGHNEKIQVEVLPTRSLHITAISRIIWDPAHQQSTLQINSSTLHLVRQLRRMDL